MSTWVLLRGLTREAAHWGSFLERFVALEEDARVVALDLPGAGAWHRLPSPATVPGIVAHLRGQVASHGLPGPLRLFGLSMGGMVAAQWALQHPTEISHLVVVNSSMRPHAPLHQRLRPSCWLALLRVLMSREAWAAERLVLQLTSAQPLQHQQVLDGWVRIRQERSVSRANALRQLQAAARYRLPQTAPPARALVLASEGDRLVDTRCSRHLARHWGAPLAIHPGAGHDLPLDAPQWVEQQVRRWLAGLRP